jgi:hypothetical protein
MMFSKTSLTTANPVRYQSACPKTTPFSSGTQSPHSQLAITSRVVKMINDVFKDIIDHRQPCALSICLH